jgi:thymidine phosphorylase
MMPEPVDVEALARDLVTVSANLQRRIEAEGLKVGTRLGKSHALAADERIKTMAADLQRQQDLVAELRRQMKVLERRSEKYFAIDKLVRQEVREGSAFVNVNFLLDIINTPASPITTEAS